MGNDDDNLMECAKIVICLYDGLMRHSAYIQIRIAMSISETNKLVMGIINKNLNNQQQAIQELFQLLGTQAEQNHAKIHEAILLLLENRHEWTNLMKYIIKWNAADFRKGFISRMSRRVEEQPLPEPVQNPNEEMKRLVEKFWMTRSPKKQEGTYREPIDIKRMIKTAQSFTPKDQHLFDLPPPNNNQQQEHKQPVQAKAELLPQVKKQVVISQPEKTHMQIQQKPNQQNGFRRDSFGPSQNIDSNSTSNFPQKKEKQDPLASVTGRPPILKKKSLFETNNNKLTIGTKQSGEEKKKQEAQKGRMAPSKIFNIMKKFEDKKQVKSIENWQNFGKRQTISATISNANQQFPAQKFNFGSNKKSSPDPDMKKITISPLKYKPASKVIKIIKNEPKQQRKIQSLHDFSFAHSDKKEPALKPQPPSKPEVIIVKKEQPLQQVFVFHDNGKQSDKDEIVSGENSFGYESMKHLKEVAQTPVFMIDSKRRRSSVGSFKIQQAFEVDEALNFYQSDVKLRYFIKEIEARNAADTMTIFQEEFAKFLKNPQSFRT